MPPARPAPLMMEVAEPASHARPMPAGCAGLAGLKNKDALKDNQEIHFQPFDPVHKRTEATVRAKTGKDGKAFKVTKGAPQVILALAGDAGTKDAADKAVRDFAARGFRALGLARAEGDGKWQFLEGVKHAAAIGAAE